MTPFYKSPLFFFHILTHLSIIPMIMYASAWQWAIAGIFYFLYGCIGVACTFHRLVAHKSFVAPAWFEKLGLFLGSLGGVGTSIQWTAVHRNHHRYSDTDKDPHNPKGRFWQMQFFVMLVPSSPKYVPDLLRSSQHVFFHKYYWVIHAAWATLLGLISPFAIIYAYLFPVLILWHVMTALGTFAHTDGMGVQTNNSKDHSQNLRWLGWFVFGEGWHNNHHAEAANYRFGRAKGEVDLSARIIDLIRLDKPKNA